MGVNINNLKTTLRAYQKVSPSILSNYATKEDLTNATSSIVEDIENVNESIELVREESSQQVAELKEYSDNKFITDANNDGVTYARKNKEWVEVESNVVSIFTGFSYYETIDGDDSDLVESLDISTLSERIERPIESTTFDFSGVLEEDGKCFWFCSTKPIIGMSSSGLPTPYTKVGIVRVDDKEYFCYRTDLLVSNEWDFRIRY